MSEHFDQQMPQEQQPVVGSAAVGLPAFSCPLAYWPCLLAHMRVPLDQLWRPPKQVLLSWATIAMVGLDHFSRSHALRPWDVLIDRCKIISDGPRVGYQSSYGPC
jgi:hypothetical protein